MQTMVDSRVEVSKRKKCSLSKATQVRHAQSVLVKSNQFRISIDVNKVSISFPPKAGMLDKQAVLKASLIRNRDVLEELAKH